MQKLLMVLSLVILAGAARASDQNVQIESSETVKYWILESVS